MGLYDRGYIREDEESGRSWQKGGMGFGLPKPTQVVKWLLIANIAIFLVTIILSSRSPRIDNFIRAWFPVCPYSWATVGQVWRLITYQFLHAGTMHILFNMLGLYFLGPSLENYWGSRKFLGFYLMCGIAGGIFFTLLVRVGWLAGVTMEGVPVTMVGASGAILGLIAACAILFPNFVIIFLFFPVPIRLAAVILTALYVVNLLTTGENAGGDAAHLAGMATGAIYVLSQSWRAKFRLKLRHERWQKKVTEEQQLQQEVDRILDKVHAQGIHSLTAKERQILRKATEAERTRNLVK